MESEPIHLPHSSPRRSVAPLLWGLAVGTAVSAILWGAGWTQLMGTGRSHDELLLIVPGLKFLAGGICLAFPGARRFGIGLLISIAVGFLILVGSSFIHLAT